MANKRLSDNKRDRRKRSDRSDEIFSSSERVKFDSSAKNPRENFSDSSKGKHDFSSDRVDPQSSFFTEKSKNSGFESSYQSSSFNQSGNVSVNFQLDRISAQVESKSDPFRSQIQAQQVASTFYPHSQGTGQNTGFSHGNDFLSGNSSFESFDSRSDFNGSSYPVSDNTNGAINEKRVHMFESVSSMAAASMSSPLTASMSHKDMARYVEDHASESSSFETFGRAESSDSFVPEKNEKSFREEFIHSDNNDRKDSFIHKKASQAGYSHSKDALKSSESSEPSGNNYKRDAFLSPEKKTDAFFSPEKKTDAFFSPEKKTEAPVSAGSNSNGRQVNRNGFIHRSAEAIGFVGTAVSAVDDFSSEKKEDAASFIDRKFEESLFRSAQRELSFAERYGKSSRRQRKEEKYSERVIREERKASSRSLFRKRSDEREKEQFNKKSETRFSNQSETVFNERLITNRTAFDNGHTERFTRENQYDLSSPFIEKRSISDVRSPFNESIKGNINENISMQGASAHYSGKQSLTYKDNSKESLKAKKSASVSTSDQKRSSDAFLRNESIRDQKKKSKKIYKKTDKKKVKGIRKAAAFAAVSNYFKEKRAFRNEIGDFSGKTSGDLVKDGRSGIVTSLFSGIKFAFRLFLAKIAPFLIVIFIIIVGLVFLFALIVSFIVAIFCAFSSGGDVGITFHVTGDGAVYAHESLPQETINDYISQLYDLYPPAVRADGSLDYTNAMNPSRESVLRYALSKVGCEYNQSYHDSLTADIFDCSSLAFRSYSTIGIDISNGGYYTAADELLHMEEVDKTVGFGGLLPGDLIFYTGNPERYKSIGHVAIYIGRIQIDGVYVDKSVEALGIKYGVIVRDTKDYAAAVGRPLKPDEPAVAALSY